MTSNRLGLTWLGHSTFIIRTPGGRRLLLDPWLTTNPGCPASLRKPHPLDAICISHGHNDHLQDAPDVARATGAPIVASVEVCGWLERKGVRNLQPMNKGGTQTVAGVRISMVDARHSSSVDEGGATITLGDAAGYVFTFDDGLSLYYAGDTALFGDMQLIGELYRPQIACLPIGDRFTMGPEHAARACRMLGVRQVVPMHYGTWPILTGTPDRLRALVEPMGVEVLVLEPGVSTE
jgi:L-ascorbate metabolism protein UlaG (beta-lactamase superfamily)